MDSRSKTLDHCADLALLWGVAIAPLLLASTFSLAGTDLTIGAQAASLRVCYQLFQEFVGLGVLAYLLWRQGRHVADIGLTFRISDVPKSLVIAFVAYVGFAMVYFALPRGATDSTAGGPPVLSGLVSAQLIFLIGLTAVNPFFEELIVRAYAMIELEQLTGSRVLAVAVSAGVQGYYHLYQGWRWEIASTAMFLAFSIYFVYTKRAVPIILAHLYIDALGIYFLFRQTLAAPGAS